MSSIRNPLHFEIIPGILQQQWEELEKRLQLVLPFAESIHIDLIDGKFAPNTTWMDPIPFAKYTKQAKFEVHLMTDDPIQYIKPFANAGFVRFIGQVEKMPDVAAFVAEGQLWGEVGLAVDSTTSVEQLYSYLEDIDVAFVMTVKAGFSNQQFIPEMLEKVGELRKKDTLLAIEVDGGVNDENITPLKDAGTTRFVTTGFLYTGNPEENYRKLKNLLK